MKSSGTKKNPWHAVTIATKSTSCEAARALRATRFLSAKEPQLPLRECTTPDSCPCAYKHYDDRRGQPRRQTELTGLKRGKVTQERRGARGRRETDQ
jgi:hypothetical protein